MNLREISAMAVKIPDPHISMPHIPRTLNQASLTRPGAGSTPLRGGATPSALSAEQLTTLLYQALARIDELEIQMARLRSTVSTDIQGNVEISSSGNVTVYAGAKVALYGGNEIIARSGNSASLNLKSTGTMALTSSGTGQISNGGAFTMTAPQIKAETAMLKASGVVQADTMQANNMVAAQYTPGAGNIW
jgi:hypothetical protein